MKRAATLAFLATLTAVTVAIAAGARAEQWTSAAETSDRHVPRGQVHATAGAAGESHAAPAPAADEDSQPRREAAVSHAPIDWGNPYDLLLHGIKPGRTRDMR